MMTEAVARYPWIWTLVWQSTLCLAAGLWGSYLLRRRAARAHQILLLGLIGTLLIPAISQVVRHNQWGLFVAERAVPQPEQQPPGMQDDLVTPAPSTVSHAVEAPGAVGNLQTVTVPSGASFKWTWAILPLWVAASSILLLRLASQFLLARRVVRQSEVIAEPRITDIVETAKNKLRIPTEVVVRSGSHVLSPVIWCWGHRPVLLVPEGSHGTGDGLDWVAIVCHELAHWRRRDHLYGLFTELMIAALPWQPFIWWARRRLVTLSEEACDDWVIAAGQGATGYAKTLLSLVPQGQAGLVPGVVPSRRGIPGRIHRILHNACGNPCPGLRWTLAAFVGCGCLSLGIAFAQTRPPSQSPSKPSTEMRVEAPAAAAPLNSKDKILLRLIDADGHPVSGAKAARFVTEEESPFGSNAGERKTFWSPSTKDSDADGQITIEAGGVFGISADKTALYILHAERAIGAIHVISPEDIDKTVTVALKPVRRVRGVIDSTALATMGMPLRHTSVDVRASQTPTQSLLRCGSFMPPHDFDILLPPGEYTLKCHGWGSKGRDSTSVNASAESKDVAITVSGGQSVLDLGVIDLRPERMAEMIGKPAPEIGPMREWKNGSPVTLAQLRGQTIWLHFGGDGSYSGKPMQNLIDLHNDYADQGVTIIAIYNCGSMAELEKGWASGNGPVDMQKVPFRIAIDGAPAATYARYEIAGFSTDILVDPAGNIVGRANCLQAREFLTGMPWIHQPTALPVWRERFDEIYRLADGEILRRIPRPFIPERAEYYRREKQFPMEPMQIIFLWDGKLQPDPLSRRCTGLLRDILDSMLPHQYEAPPSLLDIRVPGDWIIRRDASREAKLQALEEHIQRELGRKIRFEQRFVEREALYVAGMFNFHPLVGTGDDAIVQLYVTEVNPAPVAEGTVDRVGRFASVIGESIGMPIAYDRIEPAGPFPIRYCRDDFIRTGGMRNEQERTKRLTTLLDHLTKQTELKFEVRTIPFPRWFVTEEGGRRPARSPR